MKLFRSHDNRLAAAITSPVLTRGMVERRVIKHGAMKGLSEAEIGGLSRWAAARGRIPLMTAKRFRNAVAAGDDAGITEHGAKMGMSPEHIAWMQKRSPEHSHNLLIDAVARNDSEGIQRFARELGMPEEHVNGLVWAGKSVKGRARTPVTLRGIRRTVRNGVLAAAAGIAIGGGLGGYIPLAGRSAVDHLQTVHNTATSGLYQGRILENKSQIADANGKLRELEVAQKREKNPGMRAAREDSIMELKGRINEANTRLTKLPAEEEFLAKNPLTLREALDIVRENPPPLVPSADAIIKGRDRIGHDVKTGAEVGLALTLGLGAVGAATSGAGRRRRLAEEEVGVAQRGTGESFFTRVNKKSEWRRNTGRVAHNARLNITAARAKVPKGRR